MPQNLDSKFQIEVLRESGISLFQKNGSNGGQNFDMEWACEKQKKSVKETCQTFKIVIMGDLGYVRLLQQQRIKAVLFVGGLLPLGGTIVLPE